MFKNVATALAITASSLVFAGTASASLLDAPVPANAYIQFGGLDWAWASPLAGDGSAGLGAIDLSYQSQFGWRLPTAAELLGAPSALQFLFAGANVPLGGSDPVSGAVFQATGASLTGDAALAAPYFNNDFFHGDWCNAPGAGCASANAPEVPWWGQPGAELFSESLVVRDVRETPEPSSIALIGIALLSLFGMGLMRRRADA